MAWGPATHPDTKPRCLTGTWSEIVAVSAADSMQNPMIEVDQKMPIPTMVVLKAQQNQGDREDEGARRGSTGGDDRSARSCGRRERR